MRFFSVVVSRHWPMADGGWRMAYSQLPHRLRMFLRLVCHVPVEVVIQQALIRAEQERAGAARRVQDAKALQLLRAFPRLWPGARRLSG